MMLDETLFNKTFTTMCKHYGQEIQPAIARIYYDYLKDNLSQEEYLEAMKLAVLHHPVAMKLPSPVEIVELIRGSKQAKAYEEWQIIVKASAANDIDQLTYLSTRGHIALSAIGGLGAVAYQEGGLNWLQKDFVTVYCQCSDKDVNILKPTKVEKKLPDYMAEVEDPMTPERLKSIREGIEKLVNRKNPNAGN